MTPSVAVAAPVVAPVAAFLQADPAAHAPQADLRSYDSEAAFNRAMPRILAVSEDTLLPFNRDVVTVVNVVLRALPVLLTYLPARSATRVCGPSVVCRRTPIASESSTAWA